MRVAILRIENLTLRNIDIYIDVRKCQVFDTYYSNPHIIIIIIIIIIINPENKLIETEDIKIQCGIFQRDSLSPLLFCICLIPLTEQLNRLNTGYEEYTIKTKISDLTYMGDLKLIAKSEEELQKQIQTVKHLQR